MRRAPLVLAPLVGLMLVVGGGAAAGDTKPAQPSPGFKAREAPQAYVPGELLVRFRGGVSTAARGNVLERRGARIARSAGRGVAVVRLPKGASVLAEAAALERDPAVLYAEPNHVYRLSAVPNDPLFGQLWGLDQPSDKDIDAPEAWEMATGKRSVVVAVIDSGVAYAHPEFAGNIWVNPDDPAGGGDQDGNGKVDDTRGWDFVQNDATPLDFNGHGTHVAGTIGARGGNGLGVAGVNWQVSIMPLRAANAVGELQTAHIIAAIEYACAEGADVVNGSFGGPQFNQAIADAITHASCADTLFVFASGNDGDNLEGDNVGERSYPCELHRAPPQGRDADNVLCVAATDATDALTSFSNYGATAVHLAAPGQEILSAWPGYATISGGAETFEGTATQFNARWGARTATSGDKLWGRTTARKAGGSYSLTDSPSGNYANNSVSTIRKLGPYKLTGRLGCRMNYALDLDTEFEFDFLDIWTGPTTATTLFTSSWTGTTMDQWFAMSDDLSMWDGRAKIYLRFVLFSDEAVVQDGAYIDNLRIQCLSHSAAGYLSIDGTSMATPHVAGVAALLLARNPDLTVAELKTALLGTVDPIPGLPVSTGGRLNANAALASVDDESDPETFIHTGPAAFTRATSAALTFGADEAATFECNHDNAGFEPCTSPVALAGLAPGVHTFEVRATDAVAKPDLTPAKRTWTVDLTPPNTRITGGPSGTVTKRKAVFRFTSTEAGSTFQCKHMKAAWKTCKSGQAYTKLKKGSHIFRVRAIDRAGNVDSTPAKRTWRIR